MQRRLAAILALTLASVTLVLPAEAQPLTHGMLATERPAAGADSFDRGALQRALDAAVAAGVPGVVYLVRTGRDTEVLTSGTADLATGRPMATGDRFRVASITKTFVATAALQLEAAGRLDLDAPVSRRLPDLLPGSRITARQLLRHTSGLFDYFEDRAFQRAYLHEPLRHWRPEELIRRFSLSHPRPRPGTEFHYSNTGYLVLGLLLEQVTGRPVEQVLRSRIFLPLGLADTSMATGPDIRGRHAHGYRDLGRGNIDVDRYDPSYAWAAGAVVSTVRDIATFYRRLLGGRLLPPTQLAEMTRLRALGDGSGYGLGLQRQPFPCRTVRGHTGGGLGFNSDAELSLDGRHQVVAFTNTETIPAAAYRSFRRAAELAFC